MNILSVLAILLLSPQTSPAPKESCPPQDPSSTQTFFYEYRNSAQGITLKMENGRVELTVPGPKEKNSREEFVTYRADSLEQFKHRYPEIAKKYDLDRRLPTEAVRSAADSGWGLWSMRLKADDERFQKYLRELPQDLTDDFSHLDRWFDEEHQILRDLERRVHEDGVSAPAEPPRGSSIHFGVLVAPVGEALQNQLGLKTREGLMVLQVEKGSIAETSGVKPYDVLLKISGQSIEDSCRFREQVATALQSKEFVIEVIRQGHLQKLSIHPAHT